MSESHTNSQISSPFGSNLSANMTRVVLHEMGETWRHDPKFFKKFFPIEAQIKKKSSDIKQNLYNFSRGRWKGIPTKPTSTASLSTKLLFLLNAVIKGTGVENSRCFFKTKPLKVYTGRPTSTTPDIFLAGAGPEFCNTAVALPYAQYAQGIAAFEVRLQSSKATQGRSRLAVHAHEMFSDQINRRYLFGVVLTEQTLTAYMFDYSGAIFSDPLDYHRQPEQFCAVILGLASTDAVRLGFDLTITGDGYKASLRTTQTDDARRTRSNAKSRPPGVTYTVKSRLFHFRSVVGKGTRCWDVVDQRTQEKYAIKDSWIAPEELPGRESEASLLRHAQRQGLVHGIAQIHSCEEVLVPDSLVVDTVMGNRKIHGPIDYSIERVHTRLILSTRGKPLDLFSTPLEFLLAFHDAVVAHRNLFERAGILHRDICVQHILINAEGEEGDRGILIDLDSAIRVDDTSLYSTKRGIGTWLYKSRNVLDGGPHTYIDDLESFFYVLCYIVIGYTRSLTPTIPHPRMLECWHSKYASAVKHAWITTQSFKEKISPWFGEPFRALCIKLHSYFEIRRWEEREALENGRPPPVWIPADDYDEFISHIRACISSLNMIASEATQDTEGSSLPHGEDQGTEAQGTEDQGSSSREPGEAELAQRPKRHLRRMTPVLRPRRTAAHYS